MKYVDKQAFKILKHNIPKKQQKMIIFSLLFIILKNKLFLHIVFPCMRRIVTYCKLYKSEDRLK